MFRNLVTAVGVMWALGVPEVRRRGLIRLFTRTFVVFAPLDVAVPALQAHLESTEAEPEAVPSLLPAQLPARLGPPLEWID